jgi:hypothetical protein
VGGDWHLHIGVTNAPRDQATGQKSASGAEQRTAASAKPERGVLQGHLSQASSLLALTPHA